MLSFVFLAIQALSNHTRVGLLKLNTVIITVLILYLWKGPQWYLIINERTRRNTHLHAHVCSEHIVGGETKSLQRSSYQQANPIKYPKMRRLIWRCDWFKLCDYTTQEDRLANTISVISNTKNIFWYINTSNE